MYIFRKSFLLIFLLTVHLFSAIPAYSETLEYDGLIEPYEVIDIGAPAEGIVANVAVDRSSPVEKGQILVELESSVERAALAKARIMATFDSEIDLTKKKNSKPYDLVCDMPIEV